VLGLVPWEQCQQLAYRIGVLFGQRSQLWYHLPAADSVELLGTI
jgi:ABC-2 type transport system ATP-binding protein